MTTIDSNVDVSTILAAVAELAPKLREHGVRAEQERRVPAETIELLERAGVARMTTPRRFGGLELPLADQVKVYQEISRADPAVGWVSMIWSTSAWVHTLLSEQAQEEIFTQESHRVSTGFTPSGTVEPAEGGWVLNGTWKWMSGIHGSHWVTLAAVQMTPDGPAPYAAVVPVSDITIIDDWNTGAAEGTGSASVKAEGLFVPAHRVVFLPELLSGGVADRANSGATGRNYAFIPYFMAAGSSPFLGIAKGAYDLFLDRLPGRGITYTPWTNQSESPVTHIQVATAKNKLSAAEALSANWLGVIQSHADAGTAPTVEERAEIRGQTAYSIQLAKEAVEVLHTASGASVVSRDVPFQRFYRDINGLSLHALYLLNANLELHGRVILGLSPDTPFL